MGMTHPTIADDSGTRTDGTVWNNAWETLHDTAIDVAIAAAFVNPSAPTTTGTVTALALPTGTGPLTLYLNNAALLNVQGIAAGLSGQLLFLFSKGAGQVDLNHLHASGTALGKLKLIATTGLTSLAAGVGTAVLQYDATVTQWRLVSHDQGAWIAYTCAWTNLGTANTLGNGTVVATYLQRGRQVSVRIMLTWGTTTAAGNNTWAFSLPSTDDGVSIAASGSALMIDASAGLLYSGSILNIGTAAFAVGTNGSPLAGFATTVPFTWANLDTIMINLTYGIA